MSFKKQGKRILSLALAGTMLSKLFRWQLPLSPTRCLLLPLRFLSETAFSPITLKGCPTKLMDYFATQTPAGVT